MCNIRIIIINNILIDIVFICLKLFIYFKDFDNVSNELVLEVLNGCSIGVMIVVVSEVSKNVLTSLKTEFPKTSVYGAPRFEE